MSRLSIDHIALPSFDPAATLWFYQDVLGLDLVDALDGDDWGGRPWLMMIFALPDGRRLALCHLRGAERPDAGDLPADLRHFAFAVASAQELGMWRRRLAAHEVAYTEEDHDEQRSIYFADPSGSTLEITTPPSETVPESSANAAEVVERWLGIRR